MKHFSFFYVLLSILFFSSCSKDNENTERLDAPVVFSFSPLGGRPGTVVTIEGKNFSRLRVDNKVLFNGVEANIIHFNENTINVQAPEGSNDGPITVQVAGQSVDGPTFGFIQPPAPTGETVVVKVLSFGIHATAGAANVPGFMEYYANIAKTRDVDFMVAREVDSVTTRGGKVDRPLVLSELSGLPYYQFSRAILTPYQGGYFGISVYSKHRIVEKFDLSLGDNRVLSLLKVQLTEKSQVAFGGVQMEDVLAQQVKRNNQAKILNSALNDVMVPTILAGGIFLLNQEPKQDPTFQLFEHEGYVPGCTSCGWTSTSGGTPVIADFVTYRWAREARIIKYETLDTAPGSDRKPVYVEIEFSL